MLIGDLFEDDWDDRPRNNKDANAAYKAAIYSQHGKSDEEVFAILDKYYPEIVIAVNKYVAGERIYRGVSLDSEAVFVDPTKAVRTAANTSNFINMLVSDILPSWKGWPKRNLSMICSMNRSIARGYGHSSYERGPHVVLPLGNPVIGVCSANDFWESFPKLFPPSMNDMIAGLVRNYLGREAAATPEGLVKDLKDLDAAFAEKPGTKMLQVQEWGREYLTLFSAPNLLQGFNELLEPNYNGFKRVTLAEYHSAGDEREVWISAPALLVRDTAVRRWVDQKQNSIEI